MSESKQSLLRNVTSLKEIIQVKTINDWINMYVKG